MSRFGCIKDKFDERDYLMRAYLPVVKLPKRVDYTQKMSPIRDQGEDGTCVGFAVASGMKEYQEFLDYEKLIELSPRFLYSEAKLIDGVPGLEGTTIRASMQVLEKIGVCQEKLWPYSPHQKDKPKVGAKANAQKFRIITYARILNLDELRMSLATKGPAVLGVQVFKGMLKTKTGIVPMPKKGERSLGGHAICFLPGALVKCNPTYMDIKDIEQNLVLTHAGNYNTAIGMSRIIPLSKVYTVDFQNKLSEFWMTQGHPVMIFSPKNYKVKWQLELARERARFAPVEEIKKGDFVIFPIDDRIERSLGKDLCALLGYYISEGNLAFRYGKNGDIKSGRVRFIFSKKEKDRVEEVIQLMQRVFGTKSAHIYESKRDNSQQVIFYNTKAAKELARLGGQAKNKILSKELMFAPPEEQLELLKRWVIGDGNQYEGDVRIFTSSLSLAMQLRDLLARQRIHFRIYQRKWETIIMRGKKYNTKGGFDFGIGGKDAVRLAIKNSELKGVNRGYSTYYVGNWLLSPVRGISTKIYTGSVHNLEVTTDNTYTVDGIVVHNCAVGYDDEKELVKFKNSWGKWGDKGYGYLPYAYIERYMMDAWSSVDIEDPNPLTLASVFKFRERVFV